MPRLPNLSRLRAFEAASRKGSFAKAAEELGISTAAVSSHIRNLEVELGAMLFDRGHRSVSLTEFGDMYARKVIDAFTLLEPSGLQFEPHEPRVTIDIDAEFCRQWLLPRLTPKVLDSLGVHLNLRTHANTPRSLSANTDVAIVWGAMDFQGYKRNVFLQPKVTAVASPCLNVTNLHDALQHRLLHECDTTWWNALLQAASLTYPANALHLTLSLCDLPIEAAALGLGVAIGDDVIAERHLAEGRLVPIPGPKLTTRSYHILVKRGSAAGPARALVSWLKSESKKFVSARELS